jgi:cell division septal protein FtsQ
MNLFRRPRVGTGSALLDREAERAHEALRKLRQVPGARGSGTEWRDLKRRRRRRNALRIVLGTSFLVVTAGLALGAVFGSKEGVAWIRQHTDLFKVQDILVTGMEKLTRDQVISAAGIGLGQDILTIDPDSVAIRVAGLPLVKTVVAERTWKREIIVSVVERKARAAVFLDRLCEVDDEGVVLPDDPDGSVDDLTIVRGLDCGAAPAGTRLSSPGLLPALNLIGTLSRPELRLESIVSEVWAQEADSLVLILLANSVPVRVGRGDIPPRRLMAFRAVIEDLAAKKIDPEYLDLRFSGQIVVKPRPEPDEETSGDGADGRTGRSGAVTRGRRSHGLNT